MLEIPPELEKGNHRAEPSAAAREDLNALLDKIAADVKHLKVKVDLDDAAATGCLQAALG